MISIVTASSVLALSYGLGPLWQFKDDTYYSMQADGFGLIQSPVQEITYLGPIVTQMVGLVRNLSNFSYETFLFICIWASTIPLLYLIQERGEASKLRITLASLSALVISLFLQYTIISAWLGAVGLMSAIHSGGGRKRWLWRIIGAFFIGVSAAIRLEMAVLTIGLLSVLYWVRADAWALRRVILIVAPVGLALSFAVSQFNSSLSKGEFSQRNASIAPFMNYGYPSVIDSTIYEEHGFSANDLALVTSWFFMDDRLLEPTRLAKFYAEAPKKALLRLRLSILKAEITSLHQRLWLYVALGLLCTLLTLNRRGHSLVFLVLLAGAYVAISLATKPPPDRVMLGLLLGIWLVLTIFERHPLNLNLRRLQAFGILLAFGGLIRIFFLSSAMHESITHQWQSDFGNLQDFKPVYSFVGAIPIDSLYRPFSRPAEVPEFVFFGSMALLDEVRAEEVRRQGGGFISGIMSGQDTWVMARHPYSISMLQNYFKEHHQVDVAYRIVANSTGATLFQLRRYTG